MQTKTVNSLQYDLTVPGVPSTAEEYDEMAPGGEGSCLDAAVDNAFFRGWHARFRTEFGKALEEHLVAEHGEALRRRVESYSENSKGEEVPNYESEKAYLKWICAGAPDENKQPQIEPHDQATYATLAQEVADKIPFTVAPPPRQSKPSKDLINTANQFIARISAGEGSFAKLIETLESRNPGLKVVTQDDGTILPEDLARALKVEQARVAREATQNLL